MFPTAIDPPRMNNPIIIRIILFGNSVLGPIKKFDSPEINRPSEISVIWSKNFDRVGVISDKIPKLQDIIQNTNPCKRTEALNSSNLNDKTGSKKLNEMLNKTCEIIASKITGSQSIFK